MVKKCIEKRTIPDSEGICLWVFGVLPTGFGKSLYYACLPWVFEKLESEKCVIIVVTPLTAIIFWSVDYYKIVLPVSIFYFFAWKWNIFNQKNWQQLIFVQKMIVKMKGIFAWGMDHGVIVNWCILPRVIVKYFGFQTSCSVK